MSEQQYRVIADRDKGDNPQWYDAEVGDRVLAAVTTRYPSEPRNAEVLRVERPVPTTDEPQQVGPCGVRGCRCAENEEPITGHAFQPVYGHPDDDECTFRADGMDMTYCGAPEVDHEWSER